MFIVNSLRLAPGCTALNVDNVFFRPSKPHPAPFQTRTSWRLGRRYPPDGTESGRAPGNGHYAPVHSLSCRFEQVDYRIRSAGTLTLHESLPRQNEKEQHMSRKRRVFKCTRWSAVQSGCLLHSITDSGELLLLQANRPLVACRNSAKHPAATTKAERPILGVVGCSSLVAGIVRKSQ